MCVGSSLFIVMYNMFTSIVGTHLVSKPYVLYVWRIYEFPCFYKNFPRPASHSLLYSFMCQPERSLLIN
jgi:hypothetical protein